MDESTGDLLFSSVAPEFETWKTNTAITLQSGQIELVNIFSPKPADEQPWEWVAAEMRTWAEEEDGHYQAILLMGAEMLEQMGRDQYGER